MKNRRIEIQIEKRERITFFRLPEEIHCVCQVCGEETVFIAPAYAAVSFDMTMREIFRLIEMSRLHYIETGAGGTFVCLASLESLTVEQPHVICLEDQINL